MSDVMLFCDPRSGSSSLANYLRDCEVLTCFEPFQKDKWYGRKVGTVEQIPLEKELRRIYRVFEVIKHVNTHLVPDANVKLLRYCINNNIKVVYLRRRNLKEWALSNEIALVTNDWYVSTEDVRSRILYDERIVPKLSLDRMKQSINRYQLRWQKYEQLYKSFTVYYEDIYNSDVWAEMVANVKELIDFMEIDCKWKIDIIPMHFSKGRKQNIPAFYEKIPNWKEVKEFLNGS